MPEEHRSWREEMTINIDGGMARQHEIDAETLGNSLLGLKQLAERTNSTINGSKCKVSVKVKGGFVEGSFEYKVALDFFGAIVPAIPHVVESIKQVIQFKQFLGGSSPNKVEREPGGQTSRVENNSGNVAIFQNSTIVIAETAAATKALKRFFTPLDSGADSVTLSGGQEPEAVTTVTDEDKETFLNPPSDVYNIDDRERILEVLTAQMDGKADGWRFFDVDEEVEFSAGIADHNFLSAVNGGAYGFLRHKHAAATVRTVKQKVDGRMKTTRTIISITPLTEEQEKEMFLGDE